MSVKKNWLMRIGVLSICLALISCVLVGGTFAKYVNTATGNGTARVGYFYFGADTAATNNYQLLTTADDEVSAANSDTIAVPGTSGSFEMKMVGKAETDVTITYTFTETNAGIPIVYQVGTGVNAKYYSSVLSGIVSLKLPEDSGYTSVTIDGDLTAMAAELALMNNTSTYSVVKAGTDFSTLTSTQTVTWFWAFENNTGGNLAANDAGDTTLGNAAYDSAATDNVNASAPKITLAVTITATQVD